MDAVARTGTHRRNYSTDQRISTPPVVVRPCHDNSLRLPVVHHGMPGIHVRRSRSRPAGSRRPLARTPTTGATRPTLATPATDAGHSSVQTPHSSSMRRRLIHQPVSSRPAITNTEHASASRLVSTMTARDSGRLRHTSAAPRSRVTPPSLCGIPCPDTVQRRDHW